MRVAQTGRGCRALVGTLPQEEPGRVLEGVGRSNRSQGLAPGGTGKGVRLMGLWLS